MRFSSGINEDITYWKKADNPTRDIYGYAVDGFAAPKQIKVRWQDKLVLMNEGKVQSYKSETIIYTFEEGIEAKDWVYRGVSNETDPEQQKEAREVKVVEKSKSIDGKRELIKVVLNG